MAAKVTVEKKARPVEYDAEILVEFTSETPVRCEISWSNPSVLPALNRLFGCESRGEEVASVRLTPRGIEASFQKKGASRG